MFIWHTDVFVRRLRLSLGLNPRLGMQHVTSRCYFLSDLLSIASRYPDESTTRQPIANKSPITAVSVARLFTLAFYRTPAQPTTMPAEVSRALAALRCLPCVVGSFTTTEDSRREAIGRPLSLIEDLLASCDDTTAVGGLHSKRGRKRNKSNGKGEGRTQGADEGTLTEGVSDQAKGERWGAHEEVLVVRAYALEAAVGLRCLLPVEEGGGASRKEASNRLGRWHER